MKKISFVIMIALIIFMLSACTAKTVNEIVGDYTEGRNEYVVSNISNYDYKDIKIQLIIRNQNGNTKSVIYDIGTLRSGETTVVDMTDIDDIQSITFDSYTYYEFPWLYITIGIFIVAFILILFVG